MLEFFRKYQRSFMVVVAVVIIVSFSFFGTYSSLSSSGEKRDFVVGRTVDGSKLTYSEVRQLACLLGMPGVFQRLVLKTGAGEALAEAYFETLKEDWEARLAKAHGARFYSHPSGLSARHVWSQLVPGLDEEMRRLQKIETAGPEFFGIWSKIYGLQEPMSSEWVQRVLAYQLHQASLPMDPRVANGDFSLFGCKTLEDWFGRNFLDLAAQFVLNGSALAAKKVSKEEAKADFLKQFGSKERDLLALGISEREGILLWGRALGFLRMCEEIGEAVLLDPLPFEKVAEFTREKAVLDVYRIPSELAFSNFDDRIAFETYVRLACAPASDSHSLPEKLLSLEKVASELTADVYRIQLAKLELASLGSSLSLRELWDWQVEEPHWTKLQEQFGWLKNGETEDVRFAILEKLDPASRRAVDSWSRAQMVFEHPEWIEPAFGAAKVEEREILVFDDSIDGIEIRAAKPFAELLARNDEALRCYRDGGSLYRVEGVKLIEAKRVLSFADAKEKGRIPVEKFLEKEYRRIREKAPSLFKAESGEWKKLSDVRETALGMIFPEKDRMAGRLEGWMQMSLNSLKSGEPLKTVGLWNIEKIEQQIERNSEEWMNREAFLLQPGEWSPVRVAPSGEVTFFFLKERSVSSEPVLEQIQFAKESLSSEAKRRFADRVLELAMQKKAFVCPLYIEEEKSE